MARHVFRLLACGLLGLGAALAACANLDGLTGATGAGVDAGGEPRDGATESAPPDATADAARGTSCRWDAPFSTPRLILTTLAGDDGVAQPQLSPDELVMYFQVRQGSNSDFYRTSRTSREGEFGPRVAITELNDSTANDTNIALRADGLLSVFTSNRADASVPPELYVSRRTGVAQPFEPPSAITTLGPTPEKSSGFITKDGAELWFSVINGTARETYLSPITPAGFGQATPRPDVAGWFPVLSDDKLTIYYALGQSSIDNAVRVAHRAGPLDAFPISSLVNEINAGGESPSWLSPDQCRLYITSRRNVRPEIFVAERVP